MATAVRVPGLTSYCPVIALSPSSLPVGTANTAYDHLITPSGGTTPYTIVSLGDLPPGLVFDSAGRLAGTPPASGDFTFTAAAMDSCGCAGAATYRLIINPAPTPTPTPTPQIKNDNIAFETNRDGNNNIYLKDANGSDPNRLTNNNFRDGDLFSLPDGLRIVFPNRQGLCCKDYFQQQKLFITATASIFLTAIAGV